MIETQEGDLFFSISSYVAENNEALNLVEGERLYVLGMSEKSNYFNNLS